MNDEGLSTKDLFYRIADFKPAPRTLKWEFGYLSLTIPRWYREGLPRKEQGKPLPKTLTTVGQAFPQPLIRGNKSEYRKPDDVSDYFKLDEGFLAFPINYWIYPHLSEVVISEDEDHKEIVDSEGVRKKIYKDDSSMPLWLELPVKTRNDWEEIKRQRFDLDNISKRYDAATDIEDFIEKSKYRTVPLVINHFPVGFFGSLRQLMGEERLLLTYYDDPGLIKDMLDHLCTLWISIAEELTARIDFDVGYFWEDMSYKQGSLISPSMFREFMTPMYKKFIGFLKARGIKKFSLDTDGNVETLVPLLMEAGINILYPFERQAGNNLLKFREEYPQLIMMGGFDKNVLAGSKEDIDRELDITKQLIKKGGYIPYGDHLFPHNIPWENFKYYRSRLNQIIDSTPVLQ